MNKARNLVLVGGALSGLAVAGASVAGLLWLQGPGGFQWVLGMAGLTADSGRFDLRGNVAAQGLRYQADGLLVEVAHADLKVDLMSLLGDTPVVPLLAARGVTVTYDLSVPGEASDEPTELRIPVRIDRARVADLSVLVVSGAETRALLRGGDVRVQDLAPDRQGTLTLRANGAAAPGDALAATDARLDLQVEVTQGEAATWKGTGTADTRSLAGLARFAVDTTGTLKEGGADGTLGLVATRDSAALGEATATFARSAQGASSGDVALKGLTPAFLNPLLALRSPVQLAGGTVDGTLSLAPEGTFQSHLLGSGLVFSSNGADATPVNLRSDQTGALLDAGVRLDTLELVVARGVTPMVTAKLGAPMVFGGDASGASTFEAHIADSSVADLRPWVALAGSTALDSLKGGSLGADLVIEVDGAEVSGTGSWRGQALRTESLGPYDLGHSLSVSSKDKKRFELAKGTLTVREGSRLVATLEPSGTYDLGTGALSATVGVVSEDLQRFAKDLAGLDIGTGRVDGSIDLTGMPLVVKGTLTTGLLALRSDGATVGQRAAAVTFTTKVVDPMPLTADVVLTGPSKAPAGKVGVTGTWPAGLDVTFDKVDAKALMEWMAPLGPEALEKAMLNGTLRVSSTSAGTRFDGTQTLDPMVVRTYDRTPTSAPMTLSESGTLGSAGIDGLMLDLTSGPGKVHLEGSTRSGARTAITLRGTATDLDLSPFADLVLGPDPAQAKPEPLDLADVFDFEVAVDPTIAIELERATWYGMSIGKATLTALGSGGNVRLAFKAPSFSTGSAEGGAYLKAKGTNPGIEWAFEAKNTDVASFVQALQRGERSIVSGTGRVASQGSGRGVRRQLGRSVDGFLTFSVDEGKLGKTQMMSFVSKETAVPDFERMSFELANGRIDIKKGAIEVTRTEFRDATGMLFAKGVFLATDGTQNLRINPRVDQATWTRIASKFGGRAQAGADGFVALPIDIVISGPWSNPRYSVSPSSDVMRGLTDSLSSELEERTGVDVGGLLSGLGIGGSQPEPEPEPEAEPKPASERPTLGTGGKPPVRGPK